jgi:hypothetical protein
MRKSSFILGILALALVFGLVLTGCNLNDEDACAGTWTGTVKNETTGQDVSVKVVAADGSWDQYQVINDKDTGLYRGTYTVSGATITFTITNANTGRWFEPGDADIWVAYSSLTEAQKNALKLTSDTSSGTISGKEMTVTNGVTSITYTKQ